MPVLRKEMASTALRAFVEEAEQALLSPALTVAGLDKEAC